MADRIYSIDAMRIIAMICIVLIHTDPFQGINAYGNAINFGVKTTARFGVPFFFITSGYFFALKATQRDHASYVSKQTRKLISLYLFGLVLTIPTFLSRQLAQAARDGRSVRTTALNELAEYATPIKFLYYGTSVSEILWFIPALLFSFLLVYVFVLVGKANYVLPVSLGFHLVGLLGTSYTMAADVPFTVRDALFFGFFYTSLGYTVYMRGWEPAKEAGRILVGLVGWFAVLQLIEFYLLGYPLRGEPFGSYVFAPSYGISTALLTASLFLFLLSRPTLGVDTSLPSWGTYAVGIYITHPAVFAILQGFGDSLESMGYAVGSSIVWHLVLTSATFFGALAIYLLAYKLRIIEIDGSHLPGEPWFRALKSG